MAQFKPLSRGMVWYGGTLSDKTKLVEPKRSVKMPVKKDLFCWGDTKEEVAFHAKIRQDLITMFRAVCLKPTEHMPQLTFSIEDKSGTHVDYIAREK